jgi:hypothetical protein
MARFLIVLGLAILVIGLLWPYLSQIGLGRLPGDIVIERENVTFYFPLMTCLLVIKSMTVDLKDQPLPERSSRRRNGETSRSP